MAEVKDESALAPDLYVRLIIDSAEAVADYHKSPAWLRNFMNAYADGINYYLHTHPSVRFGLLRCPEVHAACDAFLAHRTVAAPRSHGPHPNAGQNWQAWEETGRVGVCRFIPRMGSTFGVAGG